MQVLTGRLTHDAKVITVKDNRQVVNFSIAINNDYKPKGRERVKQTLYVECAYWVNPAIGDYLKKGLLVELTGRLGLNVYTNMNGDAKGNITLHVTHIDMHGSAKTPAAATPATATVPEGQAIAAGDDELPF